MGRRRPVHRRLPPDRDPPRRRRAGGQVRATGPQRRRHRDSRTARTVADPHPRRQVRPRHRERRAHLPAARGAGRRRRCRPEIMVGPARLIKIAQSCRRKRSPRLTRRKFVEWTRPEPHRTWRTTRRSSTNWRSTRPSQKRGASRCPSTARSTPEQTASSDNDADTLGRSRVSRGRSRGAVIGGPESATPATRQGHEPERVRPRPAVRHPGGYPGQHRSRNPLRRGPGSNPGGRTRGLSRKTRRRSATGESGNTGCNPRSAPSPPNYQQSAQLPITC